MSSPLSFSPFPQTRHPGAGRGPVTVPFASGSPTAGSLCDWTPAYAGVELTSPPNRLARKGVGQADQNFAVSVANTWRGLP